MNQNRSAYLIAALVPALASLAAAQDFALPDIQSILASRSGGSVSDRAIERSLYVDQDETDVLKEPRGGTDIDDIRLTQLRRGETVKVLGEKDDADKTHWYKVEVPRREFDSASGGWKNTEGWVRGSRQDTATGRALQNFSSDAGIARKPVDLKAGPCREAFVKAMQTFLGVPYVWGGTSHHGVDCSGLVQTAMIEAGCTRQTPPRTADDQFHAAQRRGSAEEMKEGDLVFLAHPGGKIHHVIGFIGEGKVIEAPHSGAVVSISDLQGRLGSASSNNQIFYGSLLGE